MNEPVASTAQPSRPWSAGRWEAILFWLLVLLHLAPVWAFRFLPTQDGPAHVMNAVLWRDYGTPGTRYHEFYRTQLELLPNLTSQFALAGLMTVLSPLVAEKVFASGLLLGLAASMRYFLGSYGPCCRPLSWVALLFLFNRCFWMGFYNYGLSLIFFWLALGYVVRRRQDLGLPQAGVLMLLFVAAWVSHLLGFLLAMTGAAWLTVTMGPRRWRKLFLVGIAAAPALCLTFDYFERTAFFGSPAAERLHQHPRTWLFEQASLAGLGGELARFDQDLFQHHAGADPPFSLLVLPLYALLAAITLASKADRQEEKDKGPSGLAAVGFGIVLAGLFVLLPQHLSPQHGGFLKPRLAFLPPVLLLACFREAPAGAIRFVTRGATVLVLGINLFLIVRTMQAGNRDLEEYTSGVAVAGDGKALFVHQPLPASPLLVDPVLHGADHYCLQTRNVNLDNYQATVPHFPVRYQRGISRGLGRPESYPNLAAVDSVLSWESSRRLALAPPPRFVEVYHSGRLRLFARQREP